MRRDSLLGILGGLMVCENLGDVHDEIDMLRETIGLPPTKGSFPDGWTDADWRGVRENGDD